VSARAPRTLGRTLGRNVTRTLATAAVAGLLSGLLGGIGAAPAHAALFEDDEARRAILDLRNRVNSNQQDVLRRLERIDTLETSLKELRDKVDGNASVNARAQLDLARQLEKIGQDLARLRGEIENLVNELANTQKRQRDFYVDLDARLRKLEPQQQTVDGKAGMVDADEQRHYDAALAAFRASEFREATTEFASFVRRYPNSPYAPAAQFWLGSSQYALRDYKSAITTQQDLLKKWPDSPRVPEALLNIASSQFDLNDVPAARKTLQTIIDSYPNTPVAANARLRIEGLRK